MHITEEWESALHLPSFFLGWAGGMVEVEAVWSRSVIILVTQKSMFHIQDDGDKQAFALWGRPRIQALMQRQSVKLQFEVH